jgi:hypothetical protein
VRFALAADEEPDSEGDDEENEWTEESASVSPNVTRDHTRNNSVVLEPDKMVGTQASATAREAHQLAQQQDMTSGDESSHSVIHAPSDRGAEGKRRDDRDDSSNRRQEVRRINGESSFRTSTQQQTALDADAITTRLLQRKPPPINGASPKVTSVSALVHSDSQDHRALSHSQASTLAEGSTPGRDLVSRFVNDGTSADGTPRDASLLTSSMKKGSAATSQSLTPPENADMKRNKSAPNFADRGPISPAHTRTHSRRSGTTTPTDLPPSRTQQKLLLQRASSALEPAKHIPAVLPRPGAAQLLGHGLGFTSTEGGTPAQLHALFSQINKEYNVVRRYRNPVADAAARAKELPHPQTSDRQRALTHAASTRSLQSHHQKTRGKSRRENGVDGHESPPPDESFRSSTSKKQQQGSARGHKSRVSFDLPTSIRTEEEEEAEDRSRGGAVGGGRRDEAYEICRRLWDLGEGEGVAG